MQLFPNTKNRRHAPGFSYQKVNKILFLFHFNRLKGRFKLLLYIISNYIYKPHL